MKTVIEIIYDEGILSEVNVMTLERENDKPSHQILHVGSIDEAIEAIIRTKDKEREIIQQEVFQLTKDIDELEKILEELS